MTSIYDAWDNGDRHEIRQRFARRDEIIRMAREDGLIDYFDLEGDSVGLLALVTLCQDVAAAEREACARVVLEFNTEAVDAIAAAIRARGETK